MFLPLLVLAITFSHHGVEARCYRPGYVCGTDGKTYRNICILNRAKIKDPDLHVLFYGPCNRNRLSQRLPMKTNNLRCTLIGKLVCGTDGKTYGNKCLLIYNAMTNPTLRWKHDGACDQPQFKKVKKTVLEQLKKLRRKPIGKKSRINIDIKSDVNNKNNVNVVKKPNNKRKRNRSETRIDIKNHGRNDNKINIGIRL